MIYDYHVVSAVIGLLLGVVGFSLYYRSIIRGETKPHIFTWLTYSLIDGEVFLAQFLKGAGPGSWTLLLSIVCNLTVVVFAIFRGEKEITKTDYISFLGALFAIFLWWYTNDPLVAVVVASVINTLAVIPTFRKAYHRPYEESISVWALDVFRFAFAMVATVVFNSTTILFSVVIMLTNFTLVAMILVRRRALQQHGL